MAININLQTYTLFDEIYCQIVLIVTYIMKKLKYNIDFFFFRFMDSFFRFVLKFVLTGNSYIRRTCFFFVTKWNRHIPMDI